MKASILHESRGRMRIRVEMKQMSLAQADLLEAWLQEQPWAKEIIVHERTRCVVIYYKGDRKDVIESVRKFSWDTAGEEITLPSHSSRELNRTYEEKLVMKVFKKVTFRIFLPRPLRIVRCCVRMIPFLGRGLRCVINRRMQVELLDALSIGISACRRDFGTASMVMFLLEIGELLEDWTRKRSVEDLARCMSLNVDRVWLSTPEGEVLTPISQIVPGDRIVVRMGGVIPIDGTVADGEAMVNQASLTGESVPVAKHKGSTVYAGTVVEEGECLIEVKQGLGESRYDQIVSMIEDSQNMKSLAESKASSLADKLVPYTFAGSLLSFVVTRNVTRSLSVLMVDFSCALKLAMPLAVLSAMREAGKEHITVKGGKFLEAMAAADTIFLDKTGTLTYASPKVEKVIPFGGKEEKEMLRLAACLEEHFPHSLANAVVEAAKERNLQHEEYHTKVEYLVAHGIASTIDGERVLIGSAHFIFEDEKCQIPEGDEELFENLPLEYTHLYLALGGKLAAVICISDPLRKEAKDVLSALRGLGLSNIVMLTGDSYRTAEAIAKQVGVDHFQAEVRPEGKAKCIADMKAKGHTVIMVGDGINDSPALSEANVGIAISDGAAIAREISDITISAEDLWELVRLRKIAMGLMRRLRINYRCVIGINGTLILLGVLGIITPGASATYHNLSTLAISMNSMTALPLDKIKEKESR